MAPRQLGSEGGGWEPLLSASCPWDRGLGCHVVLRYGRPGGGRHQALVWKTAAYTRQPLGSLRCPLVVPHHEGSGDHRSHLSLRGSGLIVSFPCCCRIMTMLDRIEQR